MNQTSIEQTAPKQLTIVRDFAAPVEQVWRAWTEPAILDLWWAPKPWKAATKSMDFREGGTWLYAMEGPEGEEHWSKADFETIESGKRYTGTDAFTDENGTVNPDMPRTHWHVSFAPSGNGTRVTVVLTSDSEEGLKKMVEMGFKEGFTAAHGNLDELLFKSSVGLAPNLSNGKTADRKVRSFAFRQLNSWLILIALIQRERLHPIGRGKL